MTVQGRKATIRTLRIVSKCSTKAEFVAVFRRLCDGTGIFIATAQPKEVGTEVRFNITLADDTPMLSGRGRVATRHLDENNAWGRPGMRIEFTVLDERSQPTLDLLTCQPPPSAPPKVVAVRASGSAVSMAPIRDASPGTVRSKRTTDLPAPVRGASIAPLPGKRAFSVPTRIPPIRTSSGDGAEAVQKVVAAAAAGESVAPAATPSVPEAPEPPVSPIPPPSEERTKGSSYVLPANPFGELAAASLEAFVECTLYEDTGRFEIPVPDAGAGESEPSGAPAWWPHAADAATETDASAAELAAPAPVVAEPLAPLATELPAPPPSTELPAPPEAAALPASPAHAAPAPPAATAIPAPAGYGAMPATPYAAAQTTPVPHAFPRRPTPTQFVRVSATTRRTVVVAAIACAASLGIGYIMWGVDDEVPAAAGDRGESSSSAAGAEHQPAAPGVKAASSPTAAARAHDESAGDDASDDVAANAVAAVEAAANDAGAADAVTANALAAIDGGAGADPGPGEEGTPPIAGAGEAELAASAAAPEIADGQCAIDVQSQPDGATVYLGKRKLGTTPAVFAVPCQPAHLVFEHARYESGRLTVTPEVGAAIPARIRLTRPTFSLSVHSVPRAWVYVNGQKVGASPHTTRVKGFERARVKIVRKGYRTWSKVVYVKKKKQTVSVRLRKAR